MVMAQAQDERESTPPGASDCDPADRMATGTEDQTPVFSRSSSRFAQPPRKQPHTGDFRSR